MGAENSADFFNDGMSAANPLNIRVLFSTGVPLMSARVRLPSCLALLSLFLLALTACASQGGRQHASKGQGGGRSGGGDLYSHAMALKHSGNCEAAERPLARLAAQGGGFEIAQFHLGDCMIRRSAEMRGPERELLVTRGLHWLELAAGSGEPKAQARLVETYVSDGGVVQAATWYLILRDNPKRTFLETVEVAFESRETLFRLATEEDWVLAQVSADAWTRTIQEVKVPDAGFPPDQAKKRAEGKGGGRGGKGEGKRRRVSATL